MEPSSLTLCPSFVGGHESLPPYRSITPEPHEHPIAVGRNGDVVGPPRTELGEARGGGIGATVNLEQSVKLRVRIHPNNLLELFINIIEFLVLRNSLSNLPSVRR